MKKINLKIVALVFLAGLSQGAFADNGGLVTLVINNYTSQNIEVGLRNFGMISPKDSSGNWATMSNEVSLGASGFQSTVSSAYPIPNQDSVLLEPLVNGTPGVITYTFTANYSANTNVDPDHEYYGDSASLEYENGVWFCNSEANKSSWQVGLGASDSEPCYFEAGWEVGGPHSTDVAYEAPRVDVILASGASMVTYSMSGVYWVDGNDNSTSAVFMNGNNVLTSMDGDSLFVVCETGALGSIDPQATTRTQSNTILDKNINTWTVTLNIYPLGSNTAGPFSSPSCNYTRNPDIV